MSLLLNMLSRLVITFLPRSKRLWISWLQSPSAVILEPPKIKSDTVSTVSPSISHEAMGLDAMIFVFWMLSFKPTFSVSTFTFIKRLLSSSSLSAIVPQKDLFSLFWVIVNSLEEMGSQSSLKLWYHHWLKLGCIIYSFSNLSWFYSNIFLRRNEPIVQTDIVIENPSRMTAGC